MALVAVVVFTAFGILGTRFPFILIVGYLLHGLWDGVHELTLLGPQQTTSVPLAYGYFCGTYDWIMAAYFYTRRHDYEVAWSGTPGLATPLTSAQ